MGRHEPGFIETITLSIQNPTDFQPFLQRDSGSALMRFLCVSPALGALSTRPEVLYSTRSSDHPGGRRTRHRPRIQIWDPCTRRRGSRRACSRWSPATRHVRSLATTSTSSAIASACVAGLRDPAPFVGVIRPRGAHCESSLEILRRETQLGLGGQRLRLMVSPYWRRPRLGGTAPHEPPEAPSSNSSRTA